MTREVALVYEGLDDISDRHVDLWLRRLPAFRRERFERYRFRQDRVRSIAAFCLLSVALGSIPRAFSIHKYDKPDIPDGPCFNMTHAGDCVAAAVAEAPVGIDAEAVRSAPYEVMTRVFTAHEIRQIDAAPDRDRAFFTFWTLKESYIKALGLGFSFPLREVEFTLAGNAVRCSDAGFVFTPYMLPHCQVSVCAKRPIELERISLVEFFRRWNALPS